MFHAVEHGKGITDYCGFSPLAVLLVGNARLVDFQITDFGRLGLGLAFDWTDFDDLDIRTLVARRRSLRGF